VSSQEGRAPDRTWDRLRNELESDEQGRLILAEFEHDEQHAVERLVLWLRGRTGGDTTAVTNVFGGSIGQLISIARVEALHLYSKPMQAPIPRQLPAAIVDFTDRKDELAALEGSLREPLADGTRIHTVYGKAGVGKTTIAIKAAQACASMYPDGQLYADLGGPYAVGSNVSDVIAGFLRDLGIAPGLVPDDQAARERLYRSRTADKRLLVVLDNVWDESHVRSLVPTGRYSTVIVTSRRLLLGVDGAERHLLLELSAGYALELLTRVIGADRVAREPAAAQVIIEACVRLPLALRIAGTRLLAAPQRSLAWLAGKLEDEHHRLTELRLGNRGVRAAFMVSYENMGSLDRRLFLLLALVEPPTFAAWMAAALLGVGDREAEEVLESLAAQAMLEVLPLDRAGQNRYRFHDLVRLFAREIAARDCGPADHTEALDRLFVAACGLAGQQTLHIMPDSYLSAVREPVLQSWIELAQMPEADAVDPEDWLAAEQTTLLRLAKQSHAAGRHEIAWRFAIVLQDYCELAGLLMPWMELTELAAASAELLGDHLSQAYALRALGTCEGYQGLGRPALDHLQRAREHAAHLDDDMLTATILRSLGEAHGLLGDMAGMNTWCDEALRLFEQKAEPIWAGWTLWSMGALGPSGFLESLEHLAASMRRFEEYGHTRGMAVALRSIGELHIREGDIGLAQHHLEQSLPLFRAVSDRSGEALAMSRLGQLYRMQGRDARAQDYLDASSQFIDQLGPHDGML
jgi:tetratricopeptide (TPR) repeat protein